MKHYLIVLLGSVLIVAGCASSGKISAADVGKYPHSDINVKNDNSNHSTCESKAVAWQQLFVNETEIVSRSEGKPVFSMKIVDPELTFIKSTSDFRAFSSKPQPNSGAFDLVFMKIYVFNGASHIVKTGPGMTGVKAAGCRPSVVEHIQDADPDSGKPKVTYLGGGIQTTTVGGKRACPEGTAIGLAVVTFKVEYSCPTQDSLVGTVKLADYEISNPMYGATLWDPDPALISIDWDVLSRGLANSSTGVLE